MNDEQAASHAFSPSPLPFLSMYVHETTSFSNFRDEVGCSGPHPDPDEGYRLCIAPGVWQEVMAAGCTAYIYTRRCGLLFTCMRRCGP